MKMERNRGVSVGKKGSKEKGERAWREVQEKDCERRRR